MSMQERIEPQAGEERPHYLSYTGRKRDLFALFFTNLLLAIVSLGIYRFWGKVRVRRYVWEHTLFQNEPFGYTGSGKELFKGFFKVLLMLVIPMILLWQAMTMLIAATFESALLFLAVGVFSPFVVFWVRRYRLSRTDWRGIRFHQSGNVREYAKKAILGWLLNLITLFFYVPFNSVKLLDYQINRMQFGTLTFRYRGSPDDIGPNYRNLWFALLFVGFLCFASVAYVVVKIAVDIKQHHIGLSALIKNLESLLLIFLPLAASSFAIVVAAVVAKMKFRLLIYKHVASRTTLGEMQAEFTATFWQYLCLNGGNFLLKLVSVGLLSPLATHRRLVFVCRHLKLQGRPQFEEVNQIPSMSMTGEGWTQWLEIDALDF